MAKTNNKGFTEQIKKLKNAGYSKTEIIKILKCSRCTVFRHWTDEYHEKMLKSRAKLRKKQRLEMKIYDFIRECTKPIKTRHISSKEFEKRLHYKVRKFHNQVQERENLMFTVEDIKNLLKNQPYCYLTGRPIDITNASSFQLDHKMPVSRGGDASLSNVGIACPEANRAKYDRTVEEHIKYCKEVLEHNGFTVHKSIPDSMESDIKNHQIECQKMN